MMGRGHYAYAAFLSYSRRYSDWVGALREDLERVLAHHGDTRKVFRDQDASKPRRGSKAPWTPSSGHGPTARTRSAL